MESINLYTGGAAIAVPLPVLLILSLPMAGQREELYSLKGATLPYRYAHPDTVVVDQQQLLHPPQPLVTHNTLPTTLCGQHFTDNNRGPLGLCRNNGFYSHTRPSGTSDRGVGNPVRWVG